MSHKPLSGKTVLLGVTGGIAAYKAANLASMLIKQGAAVHVLMTANACHFINPITFESLTGNKCVVDTFDRNFPMDIHHISLAKKTDLVLVAPASANVLAKLAHGLADDMLTTTVLACSCKKLAAPAMNTQMYQNPITQDNLKILERYGFLIIPPDKGRLACGDVGEGKMPAETVLLDYVLQELAYEKDMMGKKVLVTAGPTQEALDPVRFLTNHSSGKMGYALAEAACRRGAEVTLVSGPVSLEPPRFAAETVSVTSAAEMREAVLSRAEAQDIIIKAAAVADYTPAEPSSQKMKKQGVPNQEFSIPLRRTQDILAELGERKRPGQFLCGFSMETEHLLENSRGKLERKHLDLICANSLRQPGAGFQGDTNVLTLITRQEEISLPMMEKGEAAHAVLDFIMKQR